VTIPNVTDPTHAALRREVWFDIDGARLFALDIGQGHPIVFMHGGLADHRAVLFRVGQLAGTHRLLAPDLRGSGRSIHTGTLSWDRLADDVAALLGHMGIDRAIVGGVSMGSAVALRFALRHPRLLRGLILMSPMYPGADRPLPAAATLAMQTMKEAGARAREQGVEALRPLFERLPPPVRDTALEMMRGFDPASVAATTRFLASSEQPMGSVRELESIDVPALVLPGLDPQHPAEIAALYAQHLPRPVVVAQTAPDMMETITRFCNDVVAS
jgi:pimeloyl-ACP methyl ester carboxylesterase